MEGDVITINSKVYEDRIREIGVALNQDASDTVRDEARMFLKAAIKITPPQNKAQGENAVERDGKRIFGVVQDAVAGQIAADFGTDHIRHWVTSVRKGGERYEVEWDKLDIQGYGMDEWHKAHRNPNTGHTNRIRFGKKNKGAWVEQYVVSDSAFKSWLKRTALHVGTLKGAWAKSFLLLAGKVPSWIQRNIARNKGETMNNLGNKNHPSVTMINRADGVANTRNQIATLVKIRTNALSRRIKLIASGYGKDIKEKLKVNPKAFTTPESFQAE